MPTDINHETTRFREPGHTHTSTHVTSERSSASGILVGAAAVIIAIIAALFLLGGDDVSEGTTVNVDAAPATEIVQPGANDTATESVAAPATDVAPATDAAPAADAAAPAAADDAAAPAAN